MFIGVTYWIGERHNAHLNKGKVEFFQFKQI